MLLPKELGRFVAGAKLASSKSRRKIAQSLIEVKGIRQGWRRGKDKEWP